MNAVDELPPIDRLLTRSDPEPLPTRLDPSGPEAHGPGSHAKDGIEPPRAAVSELVSGIMDDTTKLARQQFDMLKAELREGMQNTRRAIQMGSLGIVLLTVGGLTLVAFLVNLLHEQFQFTMWGACLLIGGLATALGLGFGLAARYLIDTFNPLPTKTIETLQENLTWQTEPRA